MVVQMGAAREIMSSEPHTARDTLRSAEATGRQALGELRRMLGILRAGDERGALDPQPRLAHVDGLVEQARAAGLPVALTIDGTARPLPPGIDLAGYRIVQEALTNALKHAGPARARVTLRYSPADLEVEIIDDGQGNGKGPGTGHGLAGIRERVAVYGGEFETGQRPEGGYALRARLPLDASR
jgi:signal transduction histidine kinase